MKICIEKSYLAPWSEPAGIGLLMQRWIIITYEHHGFYGLRGVERVKLRNT